MALLTVRAVARWFDVKPSTIYGWVAQGILPHRKLGRLLRFKPEEIEAWLESQQRGGTHPEGRTRRRRQDGPGSVDALIAEAKQAAYTASRGKPDQDRATRRERQGGTV